MLDMHFLAQVVHLATALEAAEAKTVWCLVGIERYAAGVVALLAVFDRPRLEPGAGIALAGFFVDDPSLSLEIVFLDHVDIGLPGQAVGLVEKIP